MKHKKGRGKIFRPCHVCGETVNFIFWKMDGKKRIFHWANEDGSHHVHKKIFTEFDADASEHMKSIVGQ